MMIGITRTVVIAGFLLLFSAGSQAGEMSSTVMGISEELERGEQALRIRDYENGVELTLLGLRDVKSIRNRIGALNNLCAGYVGLKEFDRAIHYCNQALKIRKGNWRVLNNRALAFLFAGHLVGAREDVDAALAINPDSSTLAEVDAMIEAREARRLLSKSEPANPKFTK